MESTDPAPAFLRTHPQLVDHRQHGLSTHTTLGPVRPVANRGKGRLDRVRRPDVHPVLRREVVEGQQGLPVLLQASKGTWPGTSCSASIILAGLATIMMAG